MNNQPACAYCGSRDPLTREHLWPKALHRRIIEASEEKQNRFWLAKIKKEIPSEPTIRDVCALCNNVRLSVLDAYICEAFDRFFVHKHERHEEVEFEYDYHLLKRWLLKICFNSARIHSAKDGMVFPPLLPYILGTSELVGRSVQLYVQLTYPAPIPEELLDPCDPRPSIFYPTVNRVGNLWFHREGIGRKMLRAVHLQGFSFYLAFFLPNEKRAVPEHFCETFLSCMRKAVLLRASRSKATLVCDGINAWDSIADARTNKLI